MMPLEDLAPAHAWRAEAACLGADADLWFPGKGEPSLPAKRICAECPVVVECGEFWLAMPEGVWGGMSNRERRSVRRDRMREARTL